MSAFQKWTQADADAYNAKRKEQVLDAVFTPLEPPVEREADLHEQIRLECAARGWLAFHGSMAHRTFRTEGEPDWVILAGEGRFFLVECKAGKGKLSTEQQGIALWASRLGHTIHVVRSFSEFLAIVKPA